MNARRITTILFFTVAVGTLLVVVIGQNDFVALTGQAMISYQLYLGTAAVIGILSLGLVLAVYLSERRRRTAEQSLVLPPR